MRTKSEIQNILYQQNHCSKSDAVVLSYWEVLTQQLRIHIFSMLKWQDASALKKH